MTHSVASGPTQVAQSGWEHRYWIRTYYRRPQLPDDDPDFTFTFMPRLELGSEKLPSKFVAWEFAQYGSSEAPTIVPATPVGVAV